MATVQQNINQSRQYFYFYFYGRGLPMGWLIILFDYKPRADKRSRLFLFLKAVNKIHGFFSEYECKGAKKNEIDWRSAN